MSEIKNKAIVNYKQLGSALSKPSNEVVFDLIGEDLKIVKAQTPVIGVKGTEVTFTITLTNTGLVNPITDIILTDNLTAIGYTYVTGSLKINNVVTPGDPNVGIPLSNLAVGAVATVEFKATVN